LIWLVPTWLYAQTPEPAAASSVERQPRPQTTWFGSTGGVRVSDASSGEPGTLRFQLGVDFYRGRDFLAAGDTHRTFAGTLAWNATLVDHLELFTAFGSRSNRNDKGNPKLLQTAGDLTVGVKTYLALLPWLSVGADARVLLLNSIGDLGLTAAATSAGLRAALTADLQHLPAALPLIVRANVGYLLNNSGELIDGVERDRYAALSSSTRRSLASEDRHLITRIERFGMGIDRVDTLGFGLGVEVPLRVADDFYLQPLLEWQLGLAVNRQGYDCLQVATNAKVGSSDGCLGAEGLAATPSTLTIGARLLPPVQGLSVLLAADIGLLGTHTFVRELAPTRPWAALLALGYAVDTRRQKPSVRYVSVPTPPQPMAAEPAALRMRIRGVVVERGLGTPVVGASVRYPEHELSPQLTAAEGRFVSYEFAATVRAVTLEVSHVDFETTRCVAALPTQPVQPFVDLRCELSARPRPTHLTVSVRDEHDKPVANLPIQVFGTAARALVSGPNGDITVDDLPAGAYSARIDAPDYLLKTQAFNINVGSDTQLALSVIAKPKISHVQLAAREVKITMQVVFTPNSADIAVRSTLLLSEVADVLARNPQLRLVQVQGHTDNRGNSAQNLELSQRRAEAVVAWLVNAGIESERLEAKGFGDERPLVPNLTPDNRARNRRVQFVIVPK
jgi:outer membrane protein OmpA-like peptidoglycan-associated protein